jgi:hypothetical protein
MSMEIRDALYGDIVLGRDEARLLGTYEMQRLRQLRQLGNVHLVFPSANHTRLEHCLGTRWLVQKIIRISDLPIDIKDEQLVYKAALIHDSSQLCFEHVTERLQRNGMKTHEEILSNVLDGTYKQKVVERRKTQAKFIYDVLDDEERKAIHEILLGNPHSPFLKELIASCIDADNLDYIRRDSLYCNLPYGSYDDRIFASFRIVRLDNAEHLALRRSVDTIGAAISILNARYVLWKTAYMHHTALIADGMFLQALTEGLSDGVVDDYDVYISGDYELLNKLAASDEISDLGRSMAQRLLSRDLFKRAYVIEGRAPDSVMTKIASMTDDPMMEKRFVDNIAHSAQLDSPDILSLYCPPRGWKESFNDILVADEAGTVETLEKIEHTELDLLKKNYLNLWKLLVTVSKHDFQSRQRVNEACQGFFSYKTGYFPKRSLDQSKTVQDLVLPLLKKLEDDHQPSYRVFNVLLKQGRPLTREEIATQLNLRPSSVSHYLAVLSETLGHLGREVLVCQRDGRIKSWRVNDEFRKGLLIT